MNWGIERDEKGEPVRLWWLGPEVPDPPAKPKPEPFMPAMREWARRHGLNEKSAVKSAVRDLYAR
jgi:hypothetical protein